MKVSKMVSHQNVEYGPGVRGKKGVVTRETGDALHPRSLYCRKATASNEATCLQTRGNYHMEKTGLRHTYKNNVREELWNMTRDHMDKT